MPGATQNRPATLWMLLICVSFLLVFSACSKKKTTPVPDTIGDGGAIDITLEDTQTEEDQFIGKPLPQFECKTGEDCYELYDNDDPCNEFACNVDAGVCYLKPIPDITVCDDKNVCTLETLCVDGTCSGDTIACDDGENCTDDTCDPITGCVYHNNEDPCDDGNDCSLGDTCSDGICAGQSNTCSCETDVDCLPFNDGDLCNGVLTCALDGKCRVSPETVVVCPPGTEPCQLNVCNPDTAVCETVLASDGVECSDSNLCTLNDYCTAGVCAAGMPLDCTGNACSTGECNPALGCEIDENASDCDDGNPCTTDEQCEDGFCVATTNSCVCETDEDCLPFEDEDLCNGLLHCVDGTCWLDASSVVVCNPSQPGSCTTPACEKSTGSCEPIAVLDGTPCLSENLCMQNQACIAGVCLGGENVECDDNSTCTSDHCDEDTGCVHSELTGICDDGDDCTLDDICTEGACVGTAIPGCGIPCVNAFDCEDEDPCTLHTCSEDGFCEQTISPECGGCENDGQCADSELCTDNVCGPEGICVTSYNTDSCDDGNACTDADTCLAGLCIPGSALVCDDGDPCTEDTCHVLLGCVALAIDGCIACAPFTPCDDANPCTGDLCIDGACTFTDHSNACNDGNACSSNDTCKDGLCLPGDTLDCDDGNPCTTDSCEPETGCVTTSKDGGTCNPDHPCATVGVCSNNACIPIGGNSDCCVSNTDCDDAFTCTQDICTAGVCSHAGVGCSTETNCALAYCQAGACVDTGPSPDTTQHNIFLETFDDGVANGWAVESTNSEVGWAVSNEKSYSANNSFYVGNPSALSYDFGDTEAKAMTPPFQLPEGELSLHFRHWSDVEEQHCFGDLLYVVVQNLDQLDISVLQPYFCDDTDDVFVLREFSLSEFGGNMVQLWFVFDTYDSQQNDAVGMFIDDVSVVGSTPSGCCAIDANCEDGDPCTNQYCDTELGCLYTECSESNPCDDPTCASQVCIPPECCLSNADCDDQFACTSDKCTAGQCAYHPTLCPNTSNCLDFCYQGECMTAGPSATGQGQYIFYESFDDGNANGWSFSSDNESVYWSLNTSNAKSLAFSLYAGNPETLSYDFGISQPIAKSPVLYLPEVPLTLRFQQWGDVEEDHCFSDILYVVAVSSTGGIPSQTLTPFICASTNGNFVEREYDLSALGGAYTQLLFGFATYDAQQNQGTGIYIDDIGVLAFPPPPPCP